MPISERRMLDSLSRMPFVDMMELAGVLGKPLATVHRALTRLLTARGIDEASGTLGFRTTTTLFVVDSEDVEATYVRTVARMTLMSLPILVSCMPVLSNTGILGPSWHPLWEPESPRLALSELSPYSWDFLYHRMRPVGENR